jgi:steroid Delta-isomerase
VSPVETCIQTYFDAIGRRDADAWVACFAPDAEVRDPANAPPRVGAPAHRAFFDGIAGLFRELDFHPERVFPVGDGAAVYFRARCVANNGRTVELDGIDLFRCDAAGRIAALVGYWNPAPMLEAASGAGDASDPAGVS